MHRFTKRDRVRIDIPDKTDSDFDRLHGEEGKILNIIEDDVGKVTGDRRDKYIFRVKLNDDTVVDLRWRDLRPLDTDGTV